MAEKINKMNKKNIIIALAGLIIFGIGFYGGTLYSSSNKPANTGRGQFSQNGNQPGGNKNTRQFGANNLMGEVISKNDTSLTLKLRDGGSRIIFVTKDTPVSKNVSASSSDISANEQISVSGTPNSDGSVNAQFIQIKPFAPNATSTPQR